MAKTTKGKTKTTAKATKKTPVKKAPAKKSSTKKPLASDQGQQPVYWVVLGIVSIAFAIWVTSLSNQIQDLYDIIDSNNLDVSLMEDREQVDAKNRE